MKITAGIFQLVLWMAIPTVAGATSRDSVKLHPAYAVYDGDTIFSIYAKVGPYTPKERASIINQRLEQLLTVPSSDSLYISEGEQTTDIMLGDQVILSVTNNDAKPTTKKRQELAKEILEHLKVLSANESKSKSIINILIKIGLTLLELLVLYLLILYINKLFRLTRRWLVRTRQKILKGIRFRGYEFLDTNREMQAALFINNLLRWVVIILVLYLAIPILFSIFPWTRGLSDKLFGYITSPVKKIFLAIINYIPNIFTILVIYFATHYALKFLKFLASEIEKGALTISGFYPDWAMPTFNIVKVILYAFMFIVIFPYLPGSESPIFRGVSVFIGILFSFGSTSAISNAVAGMVITYMRPFKAGDRIKIGEITGDVIEKSLLVTRIRTIKNEDITLPNSAVLSGHTINYTTSAEREGLIIHTTVTIGYDAPWKKVHELLINAAMDTQGIHKEADKKPFVLQTSLNDFYVTYEINAYTSDSRNIATIYSRLHEQIQNKFNEANVEILSPHYRSVRDGNHTTVPGQL